MSIIQIWIIDIDKFGITDYPLVMKEDFLGHNLFWNSLDQFLQLDPHLSRLEKLPYVHRSLLEEDIPVMTPGIYILTGGRQVGKSTLLKLIIKRLLEEKGVKPTNIYYLPCDTIIDFQHLLFEIEQFKQSLTDKQSFVLFLDEITYVREWDRAIKSLADSLFFANGSVIITGSDTYILKEAMMRFPGRRGDAAKQDFHLYPLSFREYLFLKDGHLSSLCDECRTSFEKNFELKTPSLDEKTNQYLASKFDEFLLTGGFMPAINDLAGKGRILPATYKTYIQWIVGDFLKRGKQENYLKEIIGAIISRLSKQITWHNLSSAMSIDHHQTVIAYVNLLSCMDVSIVTPALREDKLLAAPKKAKKVSFSDPFIFHSLYAWIKEKSEPFDLSNSILNSSGELHNALMEGAVTSLFNRNWKTFYIKADGEVDIVLVRDEKFFPIEIKNSRFVQRKDIKQILKYKRGIIGYTGYQFGKFEQLDVMPIPVLALLA